MSRAAKVHAVDWGSAVLGIQRCGDKLSLRDRTFGEFFALLEQLRDSLLFPVRRQNMCLVGTLTIRGPSFFTCSFQCVYSPQIQSGILVLY